MNESRNRWWGEFRLDVGETAEWRVDLLHIAIKRQERELLVAHHKVKGPGDDPALKFAYGNPSLDEDEIAEISRFVFKEAPGSLAVLPALADRSVVSRPFAPLTVPAGETASIYVGTPLWFTLAAGDPLKPFFEIPIQRPSDTWFGPSPMQGETCYASRTFARLNEQNLVPMADWATTLVHIQNVAEKPLHVERLNLPVPYLSLFETPNAWLFTESVTMVQSKAEEKAEFSFGKDPGGTVPEAALVSGPREIAHKGMLVRAFSSLSLPGIG